MKRLCFVLAAVGWSATCPHNAACSDAFLKALQDSLTKLGNPWVAGSTSVSHLSFEQKKRLCSFPPISEIEIHPERQGLSKRPTKTPPSTWDWRSHSGH